MSFDGKMNASAYAAFVDILDQASLVFNKLKKTVIPYYLFIDELEAYFSDLQLFKRDLTMLRDLIFVVKDLNCHGRMYQLKFFVRLERKLLIV